MLLGSDAELVAVPKAIQVKSGWPSMCSMTR
jgi:hypothetical protein